MKKRILFVSPTGTLDNGAEKSIVNLMLYLAEEGYRIFNVFPENHHETKEQYVQLLESSGIRTYPVANAKWWWPEAPGDVPFLKYDQAVSFQQTLFFIRKLIREEQIDLVISNTANVFQGSIAAACEKVSHFWLLHEFPLREFAYYKEKIPFMAENSDAIFAVAGNLSEVLQQEFSSNLSVNSFIPYSHLTYKELKAGSERRIVSVGRITENKNQLELIQAYHQLGEESCPLVFIGDWDEDYKLLCDEYIQKYNLQNIQFLGYKSNPWNFITSEDFCVLNSKSESFSLVFTEAILNGIPTITSDNLGYRSSQAFFGLGVSYSLGNMNQLVGLLREYVSNFSHYKAKSLQESLVARTYYTLERCYNELIYAIENLDEYKEKELYAIKHLLGEIDFEQVHSQIDYQTLTIYLDRDGQITEDNKLTFKMKKRDSISFYIPDDCQRIRIDLSENPSFYSQVLLISQKTKTELEPSFTNAIVVEQTYLFPKPDPQLIYEISNTFGRQFTLIYQMYEVDNPKSENYIAKVLAEELLDKIKTIRELEQNGIDFITQRKQLEELTHKYNQVISSRRWTISTKIINFFRRKT